MQERWYPLPLAGREYRRANGVANPAWKQTMRLNQHANTPKDYRRARDLRNNASPIERKFWRVLRDNAAAQGLKFRRQHVVHPSIADFACLQARLLVELDGDSHNARQTYDREREKYLRVMGYHVMRFSNDDAYRHTESVVMMIVERAVMLLQENIDCAKPSERRVAEQNMIKRDG